MEGVLNLRSFWGFYDNGTYKVGCSGATVYLYDQKDKELARFKDLRYVYKGAFMPGTNIFVAKSTEGGLAVYDLDEKSLLHKIFITVIGAQDEGFAFSPDGSRFYNIEKPITSLRTRLTVYRTDDFSVEKVLFSDCDKMNIEHIEVYDDGCYVLGFMRDDEGVFDHGFAGILDGESIQEVKKLSDDKYEYLLAYKNWEKYGFTDKSLEWHSIGKYDQRPEVTIKELFD